MLRLPIDYRQSLSFRSDAIAVHEITQAGAFTNAVKSCAPQSNATRYAAVRSRGAGIVMAGADVWEMEVKENFL